MKLLSRFTVKVVVSSFVLGTTLLSLGCQPKPPEVPPSTSGQLKPGEEPKLGKDVPPEVAQSIKDAQAAGKAHGDQAMKDGAAGGAASNGWR